MYICKGFPGGAVVKNPPENAGDARHMSSVPGLRQFPGGGNSSPLHCSCLKTPMNRGTWQATVYGLQRQN